MSTDPTAQPSTAITSIPPVGTAPAANLPADKPKPTFWQTYGINVMGAITVAILTGLATYVVTLNSSILRLEVRIGTIDESVKDKVDSAHMNSIINLNHEEVTGLRLQVTSLNASVSRYETALNQHGADIAYLRTEVGGICKATAQHAAQLQGHCSDITQMKNVRFDKLVNDFSMIRERLAAVETTLNSRREPKLADSKER